MRCKVCVNRKMSDTSSVVTRDMCEWREASPVSGMPRKSMAAVVSGASRILFEGSSRMRHVSWRCRVSTIVRQTMAIRKREGRPELFSNAPGFDVGALTHWVLVRRRVSEESMRELGTMTDDLRGLADRVLACGIDTVALESSDVYLIRRDEVLKQRALTVCLADARHMKYVPARESDAQNSCSQGSHIFVSCFPSHGR
ncbi:hypothetical protein LMG29542_08090 [Paraburkholderia humisilvae]|uniref:Uncharacterized protein n=2 Tax=Paraburkholderia humisilvae TaxID=627669 RepID=A0A6J5FAK4_9BURK|nr:hypothetical protein LMG29542_08090 [Paraburkholderia humisilvae]